MEKTTNKQTNKLSVHCLLDSHAINKEQELLTVGCCCLNRCVKRSFHCGDDIYTYFHILDRHTSGDSHRNRAPYMFHYSCIHIRYLHKNIKGMEK